MSADWSAGDLARALDRGRERDIADALAALAVVALSTRAEQRGEDWDGSWSDVLSLGLRLRDTIDEVIAPRL